MKRLTVVHIISELNLGGAEKHLALLAPYLHEQHEVKIICLGAPTPLSEKIRRQGIALVHLSSNQLNPLLVPRLVRMLRRQKPDVLITYLLAADLWGRLAGKLLHVPVISAQRSSLYQRNYLRLGDKITTSLVTKYVVQTKAMQSQLATLFRRHLRDFTIIPNAVVPLPKTGLSLPLPATSLVVTCVSNLRTGKGHDLLLQAWPRVQQSYADAQLVLIGEGPLRSELEETIRSLPTPEHVHLLGQQTEIGSVLAQTNVFVLPTRAEGMSNSLLEAMAAGLPCLASDIEANKSLITSGVTGELFHDGDFQSLSESLLSLLGDKSRQLELGRAAAQQSAVNHHPQAVAQAWQGVVEKVVTYAA